MTQQQDLDRMLSVWLDDPYTPPAPPYLGAVLERTRHTRQRPAWASLERWLPMADKTLRPTTASPTRLAWLLLIALLVVALVAVSPSWAHACRAVDHVIPQGGAAVLAFASIVEEGSMGRPGRHLHRPSGRNRPAPADERARAPRPHPVLAGRHAYRLPRLARTRRSPIIVIDAGGGNPTSWRRPPRPRPIASVAVPSWSPDREVSSSRPARRATPGLTSSSWPPTAQRRPRAPGRTAPTVLSGVVPGRDADRVPWKRCDRWQHRSLCGRCWDRTAPCRAGSRPVRSVNRDRQTWRMPARTIRWSPRCGRNWSPDRPEPPWSTQPGGREAEGGDLVIVDGLMARGSASSPLRM